MNPPQKTNSGYYKKLKAQYVHTLDAMWKLYNYGIDKEEELENEVDLLRDELQRIKVCPGATDEIKCICERGLSNFYS